jgi:hypothetical protein
VFLSLVMRLGKKKDRESDVKNLTIDGISRLVCLAKSQTPIKCKYSIVCSTFLFLHHKLFFVLHGSFVDVRSEVSFGLLFV